MPDSLQRAATGRAKCRGCDRPIGKGELRFGEALPNAYGEGEAMHWFHVPCAACMRPEKLLPVLRATTESVDDRAPLEACAERGVLHPRLARLARAERSPSARARCRQCRNAVDKGAWRLALQVFEDGRANPIGTIHASCAESYFGTRDLSDRVRRLSPGLTDDDAAELERALCEPPPEPAADELAKAGPAQDGDAEEASATKRSAS